LIGRGFLRRSFAIKIGLRIDVEALKMVMKTTIDSESDDSNSQVRVSDGFEDDILTLRY
jgi:hypothetical protein